MLLLADVAKKKRATFLQVETVTADCWRKTQAGAVLRCQFDRRGRSLAASYIIGAIETPPARHPVDVDVDGCPLRW